MNTLNIEQLRQSLLAVRAKDKLGVLAAVACINRQRLEDITDGKVAPTLLEMTTLEMLR